MNLPKTLIHMKQIGYAYLLLFDDDTLIKFVAEASDYPDGDPEVVRCEPDEFDKWKLGLISEKEWRAHKLRQKCQKETDTEDEDLMTLWRLYCQHGEGKGFPRPTKYPSAIAKIVDKIDWNSCNSGKLISYDGINFYIKKST